MKLLPVLIIWSLCQIIAEIRKFFRIMNQSERLLKKPIFKIIACQARERESERGFFFRFVCHFRVAYCKKVVNKILISLRKREWKGPSVWKIMGELSILRTFAVCQIRAATAQKERRAKVVYCYCHCGCGCVWRRPILQYYVRRSFFFCSATAAWRPQNSPLHTSTLAIERNEGDNDERKNQQQIYYQAIL